MASMTDAEKHAWCKQRTGFFATFVSPVLYAAAEQAGYDMRWYVVTKPMPTLEKIGAAGHYSTVVYDYHGTPYGRRPKCIKEVCGGKDARCLAGRNGKCVACDNVE